MERKGDVIRPWFERSIGAIAVLYLISRVASNIYYINEMRYGF